jgi:hypothetical protein
MFRPVVIAAPLLAILAAFTLPQAAQAQRRDPRIAAARNGWRSNLAEARQEAARADRPLMVVLRCFP